MNPKDRFLNPRPASRTPEDQPGTPSRVGSAPLPLPKQVQISRPASPTPTWKRLLSFRRNKNKHDSERSHVRGRSIIMSDRPMTPASFVTDDTVSVTSESSRTRDISPESLRRFLSDDVPPGLATPEERPALVIPEDIAEENEDDDNFATSAVSECNINNNNTDYFATSLSPPPSRLGYARSVSSSAVVTLDKARASAIPEPEPLLGASRNRLSFSLPKLSISCPPEAHISSSPASSSLSSSVSPCSPAEIDRNSIFSPTVAAELGRFAFPPPPPPPPPPSRGKMMLNHPLSPLFGQYRLPDVDDGTKNEFGQPMVDRWMADMIRSTDHVARFS